MPPLGGRQPANWTLRDKTAELTTHTIYSGEITAISLPGLLTALGAYNTALDAIVLGVIAKRSWGEETIVSNDPAASNTAQRESKLLVEYRDAVTEEGFTLTIGTIDPAQLVFLPGAGDSVAFLLANGASASIIAWVTAFEALAKSPRNEANAVEVTGMRFVGRSS